MNQNRLLDIRDLHVWYRVYGGYLKVLDGVYLSVNRGEKVGLVGETGCGKTTTMKAILRILPDRDVKIPQGQIYFEGTDLLKASDSEWQHVRSKDIAMIFQDPTAALNPVFTVGVQIQDVIRFTLASRKERQKKVMKQRAIQAFKEVSLPDQERMLSNYPIQLSGGMRQRVCISMAITTPRKLLIADEPGTSLDVTIQHQILRLLRNLVEKKGTSIILITHSLGVAREMTDRIYVMYAGTMVEEASTKELFTHPLHPYTLGLLSSVPKISGGGISAGIAGRIPNYLCPPTGCRFNPRCPRVMTECSRDKPPFFVAEDGHHVACFLYKGSR
jgi:peptide/nickel transport system ATP-binding protein